MSLVRILRSAGRILHVTLVVVWAAFILLLLVACSAEPLVEEGVHQVPAFEWRVVPQSELQAAYRDYGMYRPFRSKLDGFVGITPDGRWVVYTTAPRVPDDEVATTLGHEVMHLVLGEYHD